jgi:phospholipid transport system substrate-binding protein
MNLELHFPAWSRRFVLASALLFVIPRPAAASPEVQAVIQGTIDGVLTVLRDTTLQGGDKRNARMKKLREVIDRVFDWEDMSRRSLGVHWRSIDDAQRKRFVAVFTDLLSNHYMNDLDKFRGTEQVKMLGTEAAAEDWVVKSVLVTHSGENIPIDYFLTKGPTGWRVYDVAIEGVSLVNHYRKGFTRQLTNLAFNDLLVKLERKRDTGGGADE